MEVKFRVLGIDLGKVDVDQAKTLYSAINEYRDEHVDGSNLVCFMDELQQMISLAERGEK
jgi:hypothetical protein